MSREQTIGIGRTASSHRPDYITIRIRLGEGRFVDVEMTPENFAYALTGRFETPCKARIRERPSHGEERSAG